MHVTSAVRHVAWPSLLTRTSNQSVAPSWDRGRRGHRGDGNDRTHRGEAAVGSAALARADRVDGNDRELCRYTWRGRSPDPESACRAFRKSAATSEGEAHGRSNPVIASPGG